MYDDQVRMMSKTVDVEPLELQHLKQSIEQSSSRTNLMSSKWPTSPQPLTRDKWERAVSVAWDVLLPSFPVLLIIKTALCIVANRNDSSHNGTSLIDATSLSRNLVRFNDQLVTLFTIVFATIMGTFVKRLALWKAQRGAYLIDLEQYQGSVSLPSTVRLAVTLGSFTWKSFLLTIVWLFYYIGSQAVREEYRLTSSEPFRKLSVSLPRSDAPSIFDESFPQTFSSLLSHNDTKDYVLENGTTFEQLLYRTNLQFGGVVDSFGGASSGYKNPGFNVGPLIPALAWDMTTDWVETTDRSHLAGDETYMADIGVPVFSGPPDQMLGSYEVSGTSYLNVSCSDLDLLPLSAFPNSTSVNSTISLNMTDLQSNASRDSDGFPLREFEYWIRSRPVDQTQLGVCGSADSSEKGECDYSTGPITLHSVCNITSMRVDVQVHCQASGCYVVKKRWADGKTLQEATSYSTPFDSSAFAAAFFSNLTLSTGAQEDFLVPTPLVNEYFSFYHLLSSFIWQKLVDPTYTLRANSYDLSRAFNTYYITSQAALWGKQYAADLQVGERDMFFQGVSMNGALYDQGYRISWPWIVFDFISCFILLAAALASCWLRANTQAPDILGYVSSLTRENPHFDLPTEGSALNGTQRARALKHVRVQLGAFVDEDTGHHRISMLPVSGDVKRLRREQTYT